MKTRLACCTAILMLAAASASADDVAGKWNASVESPQGPFAFTFDFTVDGEKLMGSMSNEFMGATPIAEGMVHGNNVSFKLMLQGGPGGAMTINYKGMVDGDELHLTSTFEGAPPGGGPAEQSFVAKRAE